MSRQIFLERRQLLWQAYLFAFQCAAMPYLVNWSLSFFSVSLAVYILTIGSRFFIPLALAIVISYLIIAIAEGVQKISIARWRMPRRLAFAISLALFATILYGIVVIIQRNITAVINSASIYQQKLNTLIDAIFKKLNIHPIDILNYIKTFDFTLILKQIALTLTDIAGHTGIIFVYVLFILIEYRSFDEKLKALFPDKSHLRRAKLMLSTINGQVLSYLWIKTLISFSTSIGSYFILRAVGLDFPDFWAMLIFFFNFIPTIGSVVATLFPCTLALLQFDNFPPFIIVTVGLTAVQFFFGNILEPRIMGKKFNLSGLVIILALIVSGFIWGVIGMLLCVPSLMIINIVLSNFNATRPIAILLSHRGEVK